MVEAPVVALLSLGVVAKGTVYANYERSGERVDSDR